MFFWVDLFSGCGGMAKDMCAADLERPSAARPSKLDEERRMLA